MTEEEKNAIELIGCLNLNESYIITSKQWNEQDVHKAIDIILNLIEKQQKEIEEKTTIIMAGAEKVKQLEKEFLTKQEVKENYIPKDKIREKIENYQNEIECENSYLEQGIICEEEYKDRVKVYNSYIFILNKLLEEEE